ncbi:MAG: winged helix-turn-helix domain-containing protein [Candidatus Rokuibacteriota bacterium]
MKRRTIIGMVAVLASGALAGATALAFGGPTHRASVMKRFVAARHRRRPDVHISRLRAKLERNPKAPRYIKTVRGLGYVFLRGRDGG